MEQVIIGTADAVEAEYGFTAPYGDPFVAVLMYDDEVVSVEGFSSLKDAKASYAECKKIYL